MVTPNMSGLLSVEGSMARERKPGRMVKRLQDSGRIIVCMAKGKNKILNLSTFREWTFPNGAKKHGVWANGNRVRWLDDEMNVI